MKKILFGLAGFIISFALLYIIRPADVANVYWSIFIGYENTDIMQVYYNTDEDNTMFGTQQIGAIYADGEARSITTPLKITEKYVGINIGESENLVTLKNGLIEYMAFDVKIPLSNYMAMENAEIVSESEDELIIKTYPGQSYILYDMQGVYEEMSSRVNKFLNILYVMFATLIGIILYRGASRFKQMMIWCLDIIRNKRLIFDLAKNDFKMRYAGANLGIVWAFVQPIVTVMIYVFVFQVGFKSVPVENVPYVLWLVAGIVPWFFFSEGLMNATNSLLEYTYLVKKVVFKINILPVVKLVSAFFVHIFFILIAVLLYLVNGQSFSIHIVQIVYYSLCTVVLTLGISYLTSAVVVFFRDLGQIVNIILQFGMWLTPIMWAITMLPVKWQVIMKLNPMYYITDGYRDAFYNHVWFWEKAGQTVYFWIVAILVLFIGSTIFQKLEKHFADVL
ncbi:MAG: ABC transporter permease [Lachnospiraceae bacterium]|nr:ABC transporter permease [Lachnospiraceae bacterium]